MSSVFVATSREAKPKPNVPFPPLVSSIVFFIPNCLVLVTELEAGAVTEEGTPARYNKRNKREMKDVEDLSKRFPHTISTE